MANQFVIGLDKKHEELGTSAVVKIPEAEVTVFYIEGKELVNPKEPRKKMLFMKEVDKSFEPRFKTLIENARKSISDVNSKAEKQWEGSSKDDEELAKVVRGLDKSIGDVCGELQKKLLMACKIAVEEGRKVGGFMSMIESQVVVSLTGKVVESPEAKGAMGAAMDTAEAKQAAVDAILKLVTQMEGDLKDAGAAAHRSAGPLNECYTTANDLVEEMKAWAKTKGLKEGVAVKADLMGLQKNMKLLGVAMIDANSSLWEAQRRVKLIEKEAKGLKNNAVNAQVKACDAAAEKAEEPLTDWLKGKPLVEAGVKPWDGKTPRDYAKLTLLLKDLKSADVTKGIKAAIDSADKLRTAVEAAAKE